MAQELRLIDIRHPIFSSMLDNWGMWRAIYKSGDAFVDGYLETYSKREDPNEFKQRKKLTYVPAFAASAVDDIKNSIYERMIDISRVGGSKTYQDAVLGTGEGVDLLGGSMNYFIGQKVLPQLLSMRKVGVYVDMPAVIQPTMMAVSDEKIRPYTYLYEAEEICNWVQDHGPNAQEFRQLLLKETYNLIDPIFRFPYETRTRYRYMFINEAGTVTVRYYNTENKIINQYGIEEITQYTLDIRKIPFHVFELPHSLLKDVGRYQIALLNVESSDINYILKANFPFYTEQQDWRGGSKNVRAGEANQVEDRGEKGPAQRSSGAEEVPIGPTSGRSYGEGLDRPGFIHPSAEPLMASMAKQDQLKRDIRMLVNLALNNMSPTKQQSVESKAMDNQGLEAGLSFIGMELEKGERQIAKFWSLYEKETAATINYPTRYSLKSDAERRDEAKHLKEMLPVVPSITFQKELAKQLVTALVGYKVSKEKLQSIYNEIDKAPFISVDPEIMQKDVEMGILDKGNAAKGRLYPDDAVSKANKEHAERLAVISEHQTKNVGAGNGTGTGARGNPDGSSNPAQDGAKEKEASRSTDGKADPKIPVRGKGK